ncbi:hypothetical protein BDB01DRAFT_721458 [Pilobolus umbonatus]|nr:hypothetical protein BDB01DRAFT_721458 [Pilobolus umbonatus]
MVCSRSLSVTAKGSTVTQKTLDSALLKYNSTTGQNHSISTKVSEMDSEIPTQLGVPKAILDNVVFCHQEDNNWPLSEPSVLKKKFDDIFSSKDYVSAVDEINSIIKQFRTEILVGNTRLEALKMDSQKAKKIRSTLTQFNRQKGDKTKLLSNIDSEIAEVKQKMERLEDVGRKFNQLADRITKEHNTLEFFESTIKSIEATIIPSTDSVETIRHQLEDHRRREDIIVKEKDSVVSKKAQKEEILRSLQEEVSGNLTEMGRLEAIEEERQKKKIIREELIREINSKLNMSLPNNDPVRALASLYKHMDDLKKIQQRKKNDAYTTQKDLGDRLQSLKSKYTSMQDAKKRLKQSIAQDKSMAENLSNRISTISVSLPEIEALREKIQKKERLLRDLDNDISDINDEMAQLSKQGDSRAKLSLKIAEKESKQYDGCIDDVQDMLRKKPDADSLETELLAYQRDIIRLSEKLQESRMTANHTLSVAQTKLSETTMVIDAKKKEADKYHRIIRSLCGDKNLSEELEDVESKIMTVRDEISKNVGIEVLYRQFFNDSKKSACCPLCVRSFDNRSQVESFKSKIKTEMENVPRKQTSLKEELEQLDKRRDKLRETNQTWIMLETLRKDIASANTNLAKYQEEKSAAEEEEKKITFKLAENTSLQRKLIRLLKSAEDITRISKEISSITEDISQIEEELSFTGSLRTLSDCQRDLESLADKSKSVRRDMKRLHTDIDISRRQTQANTDVDMNPLQDLIAETTKAYDNATTNIRHLEDTSSSEQRKISMLTDKLDALNRDLRSYEQSGDPMKLNRMLEKNEDLKNQIQIVTRELSDIDHVIKNLERDQAERRGIERDLQDQIQYKEMHIQMEECNRNLQNLIDKQRQYDNNTIRNDLDRCSRRESELIDKRGGLKGEILQLSEQIRRYEVDLRTDYTDVDRNYGDLFIEVKTTELAVEDLNTYSSALKASIMKYHSLKMEDLNKIIKELWTSTYKGGDIDYIEIRADNEGSAANRSFNYRVVMIQQDSELNMRGRCSAGQKVLASIIIRLALAETFCVSCGIFTLDEPTTNLDRDNIESLAENLAMLIQNRQDQANFQMLIITHDEEFVEYLARYDVTGNYYRIKKDEK